VPTDAKKICRFVWKGTDALAKKKLSGRLLAIDLIPIVNEPRHLPRSSMSVVTCVSRLLPAQAAIASRLFSEPTDGRLS
jgi:hypothetical protein